MLANLVVNFLNTSLFTKLRLLQSSQMFFGAKINVGPSLKIGGGAVTLVSTGSGPHVCGLLLHSFANARAGHIHVGSVPSLL